MVGVHHHRSTRGRYPDETYRYHFTRVRFNLKHLATMRNLLISLMDFFSFLIFYLILLPKIMVKKIRSDELVAENYLGGWFLMKAYIVNMVKHHEIKATEIRHIFCVRNKWTGLSRMEFQCN